MGKFVETQHFVDAAVKQVQIVRYDEQRAAIAGQEVHQPCRRIDIQEVGRLVKQQEIRSLEEQSRQR